MKSTIQSTGNTQVREVVKQVETLTAIVTAISSVGFPIVMCLILLYYMKQIESQHKEELMELRKTIENNTLVITKLYEQVAKNE